MYSSSKSSEYQKFSPENASLAANGIPVTSSDNSYTEKSHPRPRIPPKPQFHWSTGLFDCFSDVNNCCLTCWCPCITFGKIAEIVDKGSSSCGQSGALYTILACVTGCPCFYSCFYRTKLRQNHSLFETPCEDCCVHCFCESCALCQEYRELKYRGFDMTLGWHGNVERHNHEIVMAPMSEGGMSRY